MGRILDQVEGKDSDSGVACPICGHGNRPAHQCRHVRWTFDQGGPLDFARFVIESSPYVHGREGNVDQISATWWLEHGEWLTEAICSRFEIGDGYVFGELGGIDLLARDIWKKFRPDPVRAPIARV